MWEYVVGAVLLLIGVLVGAALRGDKYEDGFKMLVRELQKTKGVSNIQESERTQRYYRKGCKECEYVAVYANEIGAIKELEHHILTKHPTAAHQCPFCSVVVQSDLSSFVTQDKMRVHILEAHPEHQEEAVIWRPVNSSASPSPSMQSV